MSNPFRKKAQVLTPVSHVQAFPKLSLVDLQAGRKVTLWSEWGNHSVHALLLDAPRIGPEGAWCVQAIVHCDSYTEAQLARLDVTVEDLVHSLDLEAVGITAKDPSPVQERFITDYRGQDIV